MLSPLSLLSKLISGFLLLTPPKAFDSSPPLGAEKTMKKRLQKQAALSAACLRTAGSKK
ncbi:MAG: hypothetical protein Q4A28_00985 [Brachymonas sp.]|nr:hypothetical protein [Brachymonas sp.]